MIHELIINNFKSIKHIKLPARKLNVFIGEPNSGKSNIIEALALQSQNAFETYLNKDIFRYKTMGDLYFDFDINKPIEVITDEMSSEMFYAIRENNVPENEFHFNLNKIRDTKHPITISHDGKVISYKMQGDTNVHYYEYKRLQSFKTGFTPHLSAPFGENLPGLLLANSDYKKWVSEFFQSKNLTLTIKPTENDLTISKLTNGEIYSYPYSSVSETLQRVVFYTMAIRSNSNAMLLFDEPESNTFPFYTKMLAERIALDETNQFFITTHNPYLLLSLIEKSTMDNLSVSIVRMKNHVTEVEILDQTQIEKVLDFNSDVFFNFDQILSS